MILKCFKMMFFIVSKDIDCLVFDVVIVFKRRVDVLIVDFVRLSICFFWKKIINLSFVYKLVDIIVIDDVIFFFIWFVFNVLSV